MSCIRCHKISHFIVMMYAVKIDGWMGGWMDLHQSKERQELLLKQEIYKAPVNLLS